MLGNPDAALAPHPVRGGAHPQGEGQTLEAYEDLSSNRTIGSHMRWTRLTRPGCEHVRQVKPSTTLSVEPFAIGDAGSRLGQAHPDRA